MTDVLSLLLQRAVWWDGRARGKENEGTEWHRSYFTVRLYCILNDLFHTRHGALFRSRCVIRTASLVYIMHVKIARKRHVATGRKKGGERVWYSCVPITCYIIRCYTLLDNRIYSYEICGFCSVQKARVSHSLWCTSWAYRHAHISQCRISRLSLASGGSLRFYTGIVIANSLSSIVIADTSERLDKNDFSRAARSTVRHLRIFLTEVVIIDPDGFSTIHRMLIYMLIRTVDLSITTLPM